MTTAENSFSSRSCQRQKCCSHRSGAEDGALSASRAAPNTGPGQSARSTRLGFLPSWPALVIYVNGKENGLRSSRGRLGATWLRTRTGAVAGGRLGRGLWSCLWKG